jgi:hypothetical protein
MDIKEIAMFGDAELIVQQVKNVYQAKHPHLKNYRNAVWDLIDSFFLAFNISFIPREENAPADFLAFSASLFEASALPADRSEVEIRYRPSLYQTMSDIGRYLKMIRRSRNSSNPLTNFLRHT